MEFINACPICNLPVTLGGGKIITYLFSLETFDNSSEVI